MLGSDRKWIALPLLAALCFLLRGQEGGLPIVIDGQEVARVYSPLGAFSIEDRAPAIQERILALCRKAFAGRIDTRPIPLENATAVVAGPLLVMTVTELDAQSAGVTQAELAQRYAANVQQAIGRYRIRHTWPKFLIAVLKTLAAWSVFCFSAWALWRAMQWILGRLEQRFVRAAQSRAGGFDRLMLERGRPVLKTSFKAAAAVALLSGCSFAISYTFGLFPQTEAISVTLWDYLRSTFGAVGKAVVGYLPNGGLVVVVVLIAHYALRILKFLAQSIERGDVSVSGIHPEMAKPTYQLARVVVILFALIVAFPYLPGGKSDAFKGISLFIGLLLSLGSSSAVSNVLAGLVLTYMRPFHASDRVKIAETVGDVVERSLLVTRVRTVKNVEVVIPNSAILSNQILNYSALARSHGLILNTTITIGYDAPWRTVHELLARAALSTDGILSDPPPFVLQNSLNDFNISYELNAYTDRPNDIQNIYSRLHEAIQDWFNHAGVEIMSPAYHALRDGNTVTIPESDRPAGYETPSFRVATKPEALRASGHS